MTWDGRAPTDAMKVAGGLALERQMFEAEEPGTIFDAAGACFAAMIAAAPSTLAPVPQDELERERAAKDDAYLERNRLVALLATVFPAVRCKTAIEGWSENWHGCVYIDLPTGQASWHYHDSQEHLFAHVSAGTAKWDGHTTDEKYARIERLIARSPSLVPQDAFECGWRPVPEGWKLVPVEDTEEMRDAFFTARDETFPALRQRALANGTGCLMLPSVVWEAMLSAAPEPPA